MKVGVEIDDTLFAEASAVAAEHGLTINDLIHSGLRKELDSLNHALANRIDLSPFAVHGDRPPMNWPEIRDQLSVLE